MKPDTDYALDILQAMVDNEKAVLEPIELPKSCPK